MKIYKKNKNAQFSMELLLVLGIAFALIAGTLYYLTNFISSTQDDYTLTNANKVGNSLLINAKEAYSSNGYFKKTIHLSTGENINSIKEENDKLLFNISTKGKDNDFIVSNKYPIGTKIVPEEIAGGVFTIEKLDDIVIICTGLSCSCELNENTFALCTDDMDNDCSGYADREDCACASFYGGLPDGDSDGYINIYCDGKLPDCNNTNSSVYPNAPPVCDYAYDSFYQCAGIKTDDSRCGLVGCSGYYNLTGTEGPLTTQICYNKADITDRCKSLGICKASNSLDCDIQPNGVAQQTCGICKRVLPGDCVGAVNSGVCDNYPLGEDLGLCRECDGLGSDKVKADDIACPANIDCDLLDNYFMTGSNTAIGTSNCFFRDYADITTNRCEAIGDCKDANSPDCTSFSDTNTATAGVCKYLSGCLGAAPGIVQNFIAGTPCGGGNICDGGGNCIPPCTPNSWTGCSGGDVYWFDSCGNTGAMITDCVTNGCSGSICVGDPCPMAATADYTNNPFFVCTSPPYCTIPGQTLQSCGAKTATCAWTGTIQPGGSCGMNMGPNWGMIYNGDYWNSQCTMDVTVVFSTPIVCSNPALCSGPGQTKIFCDQPTATVTCRNTNGFQDTKFNGICMKYFGAPISATLVDGQTINW